MKRVPLCGAVVFASMLLFSPASAHDMAIALSPHQDSKQAEAQIKQVLQFLADAIEPGHSALLFDGYHLRTLGVFAVPSSPSYRFPKAKIQANAKTVMALFNFSRQAHLSPIGQDAGAASTLRWPQALRFIGQNYPASGPAHLILLGSPLFDDPAEQGFSMRQGRIPGDGHLNHDRSQTPYGIKGQETLLGQWHVHFGFPDETWKIDDHHAHFVNRFVELFVSGQGGQLVTFTSDLPTLLDRVRTNAAAPPSRYKAEVSDKIEMFQLRPPAVKQQTSIYERPVTTATLSAEIVRQAPNVEVGITWGCSGCDLDLYGQASPQATALSFLNTQTSEGQYFKDWTSSPRAGNGYETLSFRVPVDLRNLLLAINFYNGNAPGGVSGEIRISFNGKTYAKPFRFTAESGNGGLARFETLAARRAITPHWLVIDPMEIVGVQTTQAAVHQP